jgi:hypothetical protein
VSPWRAIPHTLDMMAHHDGIRSARTVGCMTIQKRILGTSGLEVSAVGLGCMSMTGGYSGHLGRARMIERER